MRTYPEILSDLKEVNARQAALQEEIKALQEVCNHQCPWEKHVGSCAGHVGRWAFCQGCGKYFRLPPEPGDSPDDDWPVEE
jgi:hypothetical protein